MILRLTMMRLYRITWSLYVCSLNCKYQVAVSKGGDLRARRSFFGVALFAETEMLEQALFRSVAHADGGCATKFAEVLESVYPVNIIRC